eukprot:5844979-Alexandrium_andersonii.AAC.1
MIRNFLRYLRFATGVWQTLEPDLCPGSLQVGFTQGGKDAKRYEPSDFPVGVFGLSKCTGPTPPLLAKNLGRELMP